MVSEKVAVNPINIAIDGYAGSGKSSLARALAAELNYRFVDTGAMYRACTLSLLDAGVDAESDQVLDVLQRLKLSFSAESNHILLNGVDREDEIRGQQVADRVSRTAANPDVRSFLLQKQRDFIQEKSVVMEGRDIGSVIMPQAELKLFVTARFDVRAERRLKQMQDEGQSLTLEEVKKNLDERDRLDSSRASAPLKIADGAIVIDNSELSFEALLGLCKALVNPLIRPSLLPYL